MNKVENDVEKTNNGMIDFFLEYMVKVRGCSEKTRVSYAHDLKRLADYLDKHSLYIGDMVFEDARNFTSQLYEQNICGNTINRILSGCRSFCRYLMEDGVLKTQPFARVRGVKQGRRIPTVLSDNEINRLLDFPYNDYSSLMEITMFNLFYSTGCRLSELLDIKMKDVDFDGRRIIVTGKGDKQRYVFLTEKALKILTEYVGERAVLLESLNKYSDILLLNKKGNRLPNSSVHIIFDRYSDILGLSKRFTPHVFRHTFATHLLDNDADIRIVQALLGHESIGTTQIYTHVSGKKLKNVYENAHPHSGRNR